MKKSYFNRKGILYIKIGTTQSKEQKVVSTGIGVPADASVRRGVVQGSDVSVVIANEFIKSIAHIDNEKDLRDAIATRNIKISLCDVWERNVNNNIDQNTLELWKDIIGLGTCLSPLESVSVDRLFMQELRSKIRKFKESLIDSYKTSTVSAYMGAVKRVLRIIEEDYSVRLPLSECKVKSSSPSPVVLPFSEIERLLDAARFGNPWAVMTVVQIEGCMRWNDLKEINSDSFSTEGELHYITTMDSKGSNLCKRVMRADIWQLAKDLCDKGEFPNHDRAAYNYQLKNYILSDTLVTIKEETGYGIYQAKTIALNQIATSHTMRATGINLWRSRGLDDRTIQSRLSYHRVGSAAYNKHYVQVTDEILGKLLKAI